jgi:DNA-binding MarR family transcriptional regulator
MDEGYEVAPESPFALMSPVEARAWFAYMKVHLRIRYEMNRQLRADNDLSLADYDVLVALISEPTVTMSMTALAIRIGWERSRASHQAKRMADRGLVALGTSETDRRSTTVALTTAGRAALAAASPGHADFVRNDVLGVLDHDELAGFATALERIYDRLIERGTLPRPADHP